MSADLYSYSPRPGQAVSVEIDGSGDCCPIVAVQPRPGHRVEVSIPDVNVPKVARGILAAMHEAAGLPVPVVLDRVAAGSFAGWISASGHGVGRVLIDPKTPLTFETARLFAAALVAAVERAENEPDPAEVDAVATVMRLHYPGMAVPSDGDYGLAVCREMARAVLSRFTLTERKP
jgi:hypothetical protein